MAATKPTIAEHAIPDGWQRVRLGDVAVVNPKRPKLNVDAGEQVTFVPMAAVGEDFSGIRDSFARPYSEVSKGYTYFEETDLLFSKITPCLQNGKHATARNLINGFGFGSTEFHIVRAADSANPGFLFRALTRPEVIKECADSFTGTAGQQRVQPETLRSLPILLPPLPEQRDIAAVLDSIDDAIEGTEAVIAATEGLRDALLHDLLTRGLPGHHTEFRDVPGLGTIPADWEVVRLGDVATVQTGRAVKKESAVDGMHEVPYLSVANVKDGYLDLTVVKTMRVSEGEIERFSLQNGDVLFTEGGDADKLGRGTVWRTEISKCLHQNHVFAVRPYPDALTSEFLSFFAGSGFGKRYFLGAAKQTTNLASVNSTQLKDMPLPLPDIRQQRDIVTALGTVSVAMEAAREELLGLRLMKESTAHALLVGQVRVVSMD